MDESIAGRNASFAHRAGDLERFGQARPKIPVIIVTAQIGVRFVFCGLAQIGKFQRIADEKNGCNVRCSFVELYKRTLFSYLTDKNDQMLLKQQQKNMLNNDCYGSFVIFVTCKEIRL